MSINNKPFVTSPRPTLTQEEFVETKYTTCDLTELQPTDLISIAPTGAYRDGYVTNNEDDGSCANFADMYYRVGVRSVTNGEFYLNNEALAYASQVANGANNVITSAGSYSFIGGGRFHEISGAYNAINGGYQNKVSSTYNSVGGYLNEVSGFANLVGGYRHVVTGNRSLVIGNLNEVSGSMHSVAGNSHEVSGNYHGVTGHNHTVSSNYNVVGGYISEVSSYGNGVFGYRQTVTGNRNLVGGNSNQVDGYLSLVVGNINQLSAQSYSSAIIGQGNVAEGIYSKTLLGWYNTIHENTHVVGALGQQNIVGGTDRLTNAGSYAIGYRNQLQGTASLALGDTNVVIESYAVALGRAINSNTNNSVVIAGRNQRLGFYNAVPISRQTLPTVATTAQLTTALRNLGLIG